jgi:DNA adenine methylase
LVSDDKRLPIGFELFRAQETRHDAAQEALMKQKSAANAFLRWAGSKRKLLPRLLECVPEHYERYVEPFAGSACLFFALQPDRALLGDINGELINTYVEIRDRVENVIESLARMGRGKQNYYRVRSLNPGSLGAPDRAARFIYLNRFCFNGLYRTNQKGLFNVPYGGQKSGQIPSAKFLRRCSLSLRGVTLMASSFEKTLKVVRAGDFVYLDPPYSIRSRRVFNEYSNAAFGSEQLIVLRRQLERLNRIKVPFLVSYGYSREATELGDGFNCRQAVVQRQIAGFAGNRRKSREIIITNF